MALQNTPELVWPFMPMYGTSASGMVFTATTDRGAFIFEAPATDTCTGVTFRTVTVTTGCTMEVRLETVGTDGMPTGTLVNGTDSNITVAIADGDDNVWKNATFTGSASLTKGTLYAIVFIYSSGATPNLNIGFYSTGQGAFVYGIPYITTGSTWTYSTSFNFMAGTLHFGSSYYPVDGLVPFVLTSGTAFGNASTPDVRGMRFTLPFPCKIKGVCVVVDCDGAATYSVNLYDTDGTTILASRSISDADYPPTTAARAMKFLFTTPVTVNAGSNYWVGVEPTTSTTISMNDPSMSSSAWIAASWFESSTYAQFATAKDPSSPASWTEDGTICPPFALIISALDDAVGGGVTETPSFYVG